jgi:TetR/AcrR family acrAB operon transcriptional repressor
MARRTKEDALTTRAALLDAAEHLFQKNGVSRTSLADIAQVAGVTRGAIYGHFQDKAALFNAMLDRTTLPLSAPLERIAQHDPEPLQAWCAHLRHALHQIAHDARTRRVLQIAVQKIEHTDSMAEVIDRHVQLNRTNLDSERRIFERAAAAQGVKLPAPAEQLAHGFHAMISGLVYGWLMESNFDLEAAGWTSMQVFLRGIGLELHAPVPTPSPDRG